MTRRAAALVARCHARLDALLAGSEVSTLLLAYSGGLDSTVLLHLLHDYAPARGLSLRAHHVDHGLQSDSVSWARHCATLARQLGVALSDERLSTAPPPGASIEDWARQQRYGALLARCDAYTALLTAHHRDDQAETVLLHALRGSGPHGLAGIRAQGRYGDTRVLRPLLDEGREDLHNYAHVHELSWIEDPSNAEHRYARNRLRGAVLPVLEGAFPGAAVALAEVARLQGEVVEVLDALTDQVLGDSDTLPLARLRESAAPLRPYLVKRWLARRGAPPPGRAQLQGILHELLPARVDATPAVIWREVAVRRYDDELFLTAALLPVPDASVRWSAPWSVLRLAHGEIHTRETVGEGVDPALMGTAPVSIRYRQGGERLRLHAGGPRRELKSLFQEWRVPPWQRSRWPLLHVGEQLAVVPGLAVAAEFRAAGTTPGMAMEWRWGDPS